MADRPVVDEPVVDEPVVDEAGLIALADALAARLPRPAVIWLQGPLGAGKTTFARAMLRAFGHAGAVRSPTYTLLESYSFADFEVHHLDLYRLAAPEELDFIGVRDLATADAIWLVEWAERGGDRLPQADYVIEIEFVDDLVATGRRVHGLPEDVLVGMDT